jgi:hypothetical protein
MGWALWQSWAEAKVPGNDFATLTIPAFLFLGLIGAIGFGMGFAIAGHCRGERRARHALWIVPLTAMTAPVLTMIAAII